MTDASGAASHTGGASRGRGWSRVARWVLFIVGASVLAMVVRRVGLSAVAATLITAGVWIPLLVALEAAWLGVDVFVLQALLGEHAREVPKAAYARSAVAAYAVMILAPAGRASGEVARAVVLAPYLGARRVAAAAVQVQGSGLLGTAFISVVCLVAVGAQIGFGAKLALLVALNAVVTGTLGAALLIGARSPTVWALLRRFIKSLPPREDVATAPASSAPRAMLLSFVGRALEWSLHLTLFRAATGIASPARAFIMQAVALVTSLFGDLVPQRAGVSEGVYWYFAPELGLSGAPAKAVSIALLYRTVQIVLAAVCIGVALLWRRADRTTIPQQVPDDRSGR